MSHLFKHKPFFIVAVGACLGSLSLVGCGGGSSTSSMGTTTAFDGNYRGTATPTDALPSDAQAPTASLNILNGRANTQFTFFLQPSVVSQVQQAINTNLTNFGYASAIPNNQVPASIPFSGTTQVDGSGRTVLTTRTDVSICGRAVLTLDSTFSNASGTSVGRGTYTITFPDHLIARISGTNVDVKEGTCNNLPLRAGTVTFNR